MREALGIEKLKKVYAHIARRYDVQHALLTLKSDNKGRKLLVNQCVSPGDEVLDCGCGTGSTGILAARKLEGHGKVTFFDFSEDMIAVAREKVAEQGLFDHSRFQVGDMVHLPYENNHFDVVLSTYSLCPLYDPVKGALELYRVTKPGGRIGIGHSTEPRNSVVKFIADKVEDVAWRLPWLSMGCRAVSVLPALQKAGGRLILTRHIGVPLWPFLVFVIEKPTQVGTGS